ncbi:MAG: hypothetical protein A2Y64_05950 [Candidatus Coatesbacteria bacterium RBG_13_66_14]|uniref:TonB-dependent receptor-like beta-barrel domain-containing protein n=1 Tax=Candidatus Coatesbacteria bacterium RBG_13_66_14 TaxID=1817816 RepID=A0A1F5FFD4_9BACT|nr:MAG: hypothetical protein A2Y64_05950 [Candidatus Coatesbacteria bacterium RBG_13_66_14]
MIRSLIAFLPLLLTLPAVTLTRSEEAALAETEALLGEHGSPDPRAEALARRVLVAGERFTDSPGALEADPVGEALHPEPRTQFFRFDGSLDSNVNGRAGVLHALELGHFAYSLAGSYDVRDRLSGMREAIEGRLSAGWLDPRGHRLILRSDYDRWGYDLGEGYQEQNAWTTSLLGVWRPEDEVTTFADAGVGSLEQRGPEWFGVLDAHAALGARLFIGSSDFLAADLAYRYSDAAVSRQGASLYVSNTFTSDRVLFVSTGVGMTFVGEPILEYGGAVRLLFGPLSLVSLVGRRRAETPEPDREWLRVEGLNRPGPMETRVTEDYYLEYSLHLSESSAAGVRGGYRRVIAPPEYALDPEGGIAFANGPERELFVFDAYCDYRLPADFCRGRLRVNYELADATPPWGPSDAVPPPHFALHSLDLGLELVPLDWLTGAILLGYTSRRRDGLGGELPGAVDLGLEVVFSVSDVARLTLFGTNLLDQPLFIYAGAPRDPPALGLGLTLAW